mmetsp:Transcript_62019/g.149398  ORF Transcript_62019/g.149398 Transcript_62019/m.149398 type:complete len:261 (-) Transcript_62019:136-918(-)
MGPAAVHHVRARVRGHGQRPRPPRGGAPLPGGRDVRLHRRPLRRRQVQDLPPRDGGNAGAQLDLPAERAARLQQLQQRAERAARDVHQDARPRRAVRRHRVRGDHLRRVLGPRHGHKALQLRQLGRGDLLQRRAPRPVHRLPSAQAAGPHRQLHRHGARDQAAVGLGAVDLLEGLLRRRLSHHVADGCHHPHDGRPARVEAQARLAAYALRQSRQGVRRPTCGDARPPMSTTLISMAVDVRERTVAPNDRDEDLRRYGRV